MRTIGALDVGTECTRLLSSAKALLRKGHDHYITSTIYFNPNLTAAEAKLAFQQRQRRQDAKTVKLTTGETLANHHLLLAMHLLMLLQCCTRQRQAPVPVLTSSNLSAGASSFTPISVSDVHSSTTTVCLASW